MIRETGHRPKHHPFGLLAFDRGGNPPVTIHLCECAQCKKTDPQKKIQQRIVNGFKVHKIQHRRDNQ